MVNNKNDSVNSKTCLLLFDKHFCYALSIIIFPILSTNAYVAIERSPSVKKMKLLSLEKDAMKLVSKAARNSELIFTDWNNLLATVAAEVETYQKYLKLKLSRGHNLVSFVKLQNWKIL